MGMSGDELKAYLSGQYGDGMAWISDNGKQGQVDGLEKDFGNKIYRIWQWLDVGSKEKVDTKKDPGDNWWIVVMCIETHGALVVGMVRHGRGETRERGRTSAVCCVCKKSIRGLMLNKHQMCSLRGC